MQPRWSVVLAALSLPSLAAAQGRDAPLEVRWSTGERNPSTAILALDHDDDNDDGVLCYEVYRDEAAMAEHREGTALLALMDVIADLIAGAPDITYVTPVGAKIDPSVAMPRSIADA